MSTAHAQSASDSTAHEQLLSPRVKGTFLTFVQEHCMVESWLFRKVDFRSHFRQNSRIPLWGSKILGTLQLQVFPEALGIVVCTVSGFYTVFDSTVQYNTKQLKTSSGQK
jgi:hypothetical protein